MDETCQIGEPHFVNKFFCGLGPDYEVFLTAFNQNHNILPIRDPNNRDVVLKEAFTFETAIFAVSQEEDRQRSATAKIAHRAMMAQDVSCCGYCGRKGHDKSTCWKLHPELRRERIKLVTTDDNGKCRVGRRKGRRRLMHWNLPRMRLLHTSNLIKLDWLSGKMTSKATLD
jgi:hypothetical protein